MTTVVLRDNPDWRVTIQTVTIGDIIAAEKSEVEFASMEWAQQICEWVSDDGWENTYGDSWCHMPVSEVPADVMYEAAFVIWDTVRPKVPSWLAGSATDTTEKSE